MVVDEHEIIRFGVRRLLAAKAPTFTVLAAEDAQQAIREARAHSPAVVVLEISPSDGLAAGLALLRRLKRLPKPPRIIALTGCDSPRASELTLREGIDSYLSKRGPLSHLVAAIEGIECKINTINTKGAEFSGDSGACRISGPHALPASSAITPREHYVMAQIVAGLRSHEIAAGAGISPRTVEKHRQNLMQKLGVRTIAQLVALVYKSISPSAHQPISPSAHQPISPSAHQPISPSAHQRWRPRDCRQAVIIAVHFKVLRSAVIAVMFGNFR